MPLQVGDPAVPFRAATTTRPDYVFDSAAGRYLVLCFPPADLDNQKQLAADIQAHEKLFDDLKLAFFGVVRSGDVAPEIVERVPGIRWFLDEACAVSAAYDVGGEGGPTQDHWYVVDPGFAILISAPWSETKQVLAAL